MKKNCWYIKLCLLLSGLAWQTIAAAQDLHFSQFMNSPLLTNPANTGFIPDADYRLSAQFRDQWSSIMTVPYRTMSAWGDAQISQNDAATGWLGVGGLILRDVAGSGTLTSTRVYGSIAYHQMVNAGSLVSLGFNVGWANKSINVNNLKFPDQFDGQFFDSKLPTAVAFDRNNINYLDMQVGGNYAYFPNSTIYLNAGFSVHHVNRPRESFFDAQPGVDNRIPVRYTGFLNGSFKINDQLIINPNAYYSLQANASEIVGGMNAHYNLSGDGEEVLIGGVYYRLGDAFIPMIGLGYKDYTFTFTYDATVSSLRDYNSGRGAYEFSLVKSGLFERFNGNRRQSLCPTFRSAY